MEQTVYLLLENGQCMEGKAFGAPVTETVGEVVFTTAMTGYCETLTDPSYCGQMVVQTFPLIGNYGMIPEDFESGRPQLCAYIVREWCQNPSNFRNGGDLDTFLRKWEIPGIYGLDTRKLTRLLREKGVMNGKLTTQKPQGSPEELKALASFRVTKPVDKVTCSAAQSYGEESSAFHVVLWDFGAKRNILRELLDMGCRVTVVPAGTSAKEILSMAPDGVMLSNGPGDPTDNPEIIREVGALMASGVPIMGICLGHQLMALAKGGETDKLKYGHRGANQPIREEKTGRIYITSQNHGYAVSKAPQGAVVSFTNVNDNTCEGLEYTDCPAFSVQFHPEACGGPKDTEMLFLRLCRMMEETKNTREETVVCR